MEDEAVEQIQASYDLVRRAKRVLRRLEEKLSCIAGASPMFYLNDQDTGSGSRKNRVRRPGYVAVVEAKIDLEISLFKYLSQPSEELEADLLREIIRAQRFARF